MQNRMKNRPDPRAYLPVRPVAFAVLAALAAAARPGIEILDEVNGTVPGSPLLGPGTLYRLLRELRHDGLIARSQSPRSVQDDRQTFHRLTPLGEAVLRAETARLQRTLALAAGISPASPR
jgi:DNA-binding PadR family transcriptional regulator